MSHLASCLPNDSYPSGLGRALWSLYHGHFRRDLGAMLSVLLDEHRAGWIALVGADFGLLPSTGQPASADAANPSRDELKGAVPLCYCHGARREEGREFTQDNATWSGCEWAYAFVPAACPEHEVMLVLSSYLATGQKMVGSFGRGDSAAQWAIVALVALGGLEPDWDALDAPKSLKRRLDIQSSGRSRGLTYSGISHLFDGQGGATALAWRGGQPSLLLPRPDPVGVIGFDREGDSPSLPLALAMLLDFRGDEELARQLGRDFDLQVLGPLAGQTHWQLGGEEIDNFLRGRPLPL